MDESRKNSDRLRESSDESGPSIVEAFVFKLGHVLGGRREVLKTPAAELLGHLDSVMSREDAEAEKERARVFMNFMVQMITQPAPMGGKEDPKITEIRTKFVEEYQPKQQNQPTVIYDWDEELMKRVIQQQEGGN